MKVFFCSRRYYSARQQSIFELLCVRMPWCRMPTAALLRCAVAPFPSRRFVSHSAASHRSNATDPRRGLTGSRSRACLIRQSTETDKPAWMGAA